MAELTSRECFTISTGLDCTKRSGHIFIHLFICAVFVCSFVLLTVAHHLDSLPTCSVNPIPRSVRAESVVLEIFFAYSSFNKQCFIAKQSLSGLGWAVNTNNYSSTKPQRENSNAFRARSYSFIFFLKKKKD